LINFIMQSTGVTFNLPGVGPFDQVAGDDKLFHGFEEDPEG
jgi:hypothetical protein